MRGLTAQKESLWILTLSAKLERSEILVPMALWNIWGMPAPLLQGKNIFHGEFAFFGAVKEMLKKFRWQVQPFDFRHLR